MAEKQMIPERPLARGDRPDTPLWQPGPGSKAQMWAQAAAMRSVEASVMKIKAERERLGRDRRNSED